MILKPKYLLPLPLILLLLWYFPYPSTQPKPSFQLGIFPVSKCSGNVCIEINPYLELTDVMFYLARWNSNENMSYARDVETYFSHYRNHRAVLLAKKALKEGISYDAIPKFALELNSPDWSGYIVSRVRGNEKLLKELTLAMRDFVRDSNFSRFYTSHMDFYQEQIKLFLEENSKAQVRPKEVSLEKLLVELSKDNGTHRR